MVAWGINDFGQLGNGSTVYATSPGQVVGLEDIAVSDIAAAGWHSLAITTSGGKQLFLSYLFNPGCRGNLRTGAFAACIHASSMYMVRLLLQ